MNEIIDQILSESVAITNSGLLEEKNTEGEQSWQDECVDLVDQQNNKIPFGGENLDNFCNKLTLIFGVCETGKTTIIQEIIYLLRKKISRIIHFTLSDRLAEEKGFEKLSLENLSRIYEEQKIKNLQVRTILTIYKQCNVSNEHNLLDNELLDNELLDNELLDNELLGNELLGNNQEIEVKFHDLYSNLMLVFDDCASFFENQYKESIITDLFHNGRRDGITMICTSHYDKDIPPSIRRAAHTMIFTTAQSAMDHFTTISNAHDKQVKKRIELAVPEIFGQYDRASTCKKLIFLQNEAEKIQYMY